MAKLNLYQITALLHPEKDSKEDTELILEPHFKLAKSDKIAAQLTVRSIDDKYENVLDRIEIIVRPF